MKKYYFEIKSDLKSNKGIQISGGYVFAKDLIETMQIISINNFSSSMTEIRIIEVKDNERLKKLSKTYLN